MSVHSDMTIETAAAVSSLGTMPDLRGTVPETDLFLDFFFILSPWQWGSLDEKF